MRKCIWRITKLKNIEEYSVKGDERELVVGVRRGL